MKPFVLLVTLFIGLSFAQDLSAEEVVANLTERAETLQNATFLVTGNLIDADGQEIPLEVNISMLPKEGLLRADFIQPDAVADNSIIVDGEDVYNYVYLTNQVSIFPLGDPEALGGLFPSSEDGTTFEFTLNFAELFEGWDISSQGSQDSPVGKVYTLRFDNQETEDIILSHVDTTVVDGTWVPYTMDFYNPEDRLVAEIIFNDFTTDTGLNPDDVRYIDPSAEVIDER
jgi:outer membrane lipoprotein-sorting protein